MRITKKGHACVRLEKDSATLVIDPGGFSESDAAVGADVIAITHEHPDHFDMDRLRAAVRAKPDLQICTHSGIAAQLGELGANVHEVAHGDSVQVAGFDMHIYGEQHAVIHPEIPIIRNVGFRIESGNGTVFHPGDALTIPEDPVDTLFLPIHAPWSKIAEVIDYVREVRPHDALAIHDGLLNEDGAGVYAAGLNARLSNISYERLLPGEGRDV